MLNINIKRRRPSILVFILKKAVDKRGKLI